MIQWTATQFPVYKDSGFLQVSYAGFMRFQNFTDQVKMVVFKNVIVLITIAK